MSRDTPFPATPPLLSSNGMLCFGNYRIVSLVESRDSLARLASSIVSSVRFTLVPSLIPQRTDLSFREYLTVLCRTWTKVFLRLVYLPPPRHSTSYSMTSLVRNMNQSALMVVLVHTPHLTVRKQRYKESRNMNQSPSEFSSCATLLNASLRTHRVT